VHVVGFAFHKVLENVVNAVIVHYFVQIVVDVELRARIYDSFKFFQQLIERQVVGFRNGIKVHFVVDSFNDADFQLALVGFRTNADILWTLNVVLFHIFLDDINKLLAISLRFAPTPFMVFNSSRVMG